ncbi:MAG: ABC transporter permease [Chloroflexota bacterium]
MKLYLRLAWRNIWRHRRRTIIIILAMGLGLSMMMIYDGLIGGFDQAVYGSAVKILGGNLQVHAPGYRLNANQTPLLPLPDDQKIIQTARSHPRVLTATRRINTGGLATSREGAFVVGITGIEPEEEQQVSLAAQNVIQGRYLQKDDQDVVFIGKGLADAMGVQVGDRITLLGRATHDQMRRRTMTVAGIFNLGMPEVEKRTVYISLAEAQSLYDLDHQVTEVVIFLKKLGEEEMVLKDLSQQLSGAEIDTWKTNFPELEQAIRTKSAVMNIFSVIIIMIAAVGVVNLLLMAVYERQREIGILASLGLRPSQISLLFILEGTMIGLVGAATGGVLGLLFNGLLRYFGLDYSQFANITSYMALINGRIYPEWGLNMYVQRALTVAIISTLAAFYPAFEASRREPAEALHTV